MKNLFCEGLMENDISKLLMVPKSDLHNHSGKGCTRTWLKERLKVNFPKAPDRFDGIEGMQEWFQMKSSHIAGMLKALSLGGKVHLQRLNVTTSKDFQ